MLIFFFQKINGIKIFNHLSIMNLKVNTLNGIQIPQDIITLSGDETIYGHLNLDSLQVKGNLQVDGLIDKVNLTHLDQRYISSLKNTFQNLTFYKPVYIDRLKLNGTSNGFHIESIFADSVFNNSQNVHIFGPTTITSIFSCNSIEVSNRINEQNINNYVTTNSASVLSQRVIFKQPVQFMNVILHDTIDGLPIEELLLSVDFLDEHKIIYGGKNFKEIVNVQELLIEGSINQIRPNNFMRYSQEQKVIGQKLFTDARMKRIYSDSMLILSANINNYNFNKMVANSVWLNKPQQLNVILHCVNCSSPFVTTTFINSKNFTHFCQNYLSKSVPQTVIGNKNFIVPQNFVEIKTKQGVSGINMSKIHDEVITLNGHNIIRNSVILYSDFILKSGQLTVTNFNDIDINEYYRNMVHNNHSLIEIHGKIIYQKGFDLHANMNVVRLNDKIPEQLFISTKDDHEIKSNIHFFGRIITTGNVKVNERVNGIDIVQLNQNILKVDDRGSINGSINFMNNIAVNELIVHGTVDDIFINRNLVLLKNAQQNVNQLILNGPTEFKQNINVWGTVNGFHHDNFNKIVLIDSTETQFLNVSKTFGSIQAAHIQQLSGDVQIKVINGIEMARFKETAVYSTTNKTINIAQHFLQNVTFTNRQVTVLGRVNKLDIFSDVIRTDSINQTITGMKTFENVTFDSDVEVEGFVNGLNLSAIHNNIMYTIGRQKFPQTMQFNTPIYLLNNNTVSYINNFEPENLLTLKGNHQVNGELQFSGLQTKFIESKYVNQVNLTQIAENVLYLKSDKVQHVPGTIIVNYAQFDSDVNLKYHLNKVDLNEAVEAANQKLIQNFDINEITKTIQTNTNKLYQQRNRYEFANFEIEYLQPSQILIPDGFVEQFTFETKLGHHVHEVLNQLHSTFSSTVIHQPFFFKSILYIAMIEATNEGILLQILYFDFRYKPTLIYKNYYRSG